MSIDTEMTLSLENKLADAVVKILKTNTPLGDLVEGRIYREDPDTIDEFMKSDTIYVWPEFTQTQLRPQPGDFAWPIVVLMVLLITGRRGRSFDPGELGPVDILVHIEKILERGSSNAGGDTGKLFDPTLVDPLAPGVTDVERYLNRQRPKFYRRSKRIIPRTKTNGWPLLVQYGTISTREERMPA